MKSPSTILNCLSLLCLVHVGFAQDIDGLRNQKELISDHIQLLNTSLQGSQNKKSDLIEEYQLIQSSINQRHSLGQIINQEIAYLDTLISRVKIDASSVNLDQVWRKSELTKLIRRDFYGQLLNSRNTNYFTNNVLVQNVIEHQYQSYLQNREVKNVQQLSNEANTLKDSIAVLEIMRLEKEELFLSGQKNIENLRTDISTSEKLIKLMQSEEQRLQEQIDRQQSAQQTVNQRISESIGRSETVTLSEDEENRKEGFVTEKGKLKWPVSAGVISKPFGELQSDDLATIRYKNNGIDMICPINSEVKSIYDGTVIMSAVRPPYDHVIIINHGAYTTAYFHLTESDVSIDQVVQSGQKIGRLSPQNSGVPFHFEIWYEQKQIDPQEWLRKR